MKRYFLLTTLFCTIMINSQDLKSYQNEIFTNGNDSLRYRMLEPENFDKNKKYPLVLFMHGSGERGSDNEAQLVHGSKLFLEKENRKNYNSFVIFPQCSAKDYWANIDYSFKENGLGFSFKKEPEPLPSLAMVLKLMDSLIKHPNVDAKRIYVAGLSMGGMAAFELLYHRPDMFAAAIPICGGGNVEAAKIYAKKVPTWIFHGKEDTVVNRKYSEEMHKAITASGGKSKLTIYEDVGHDSWNNAFAAPDFLKWLFSHRKE